MTERVTSVPLEAGLYVLRYVQTSSSSEAQHVFVRPSPGSEDVVTVVSPPGERPGLIPAPGGCVVVRAEQTGSLHVTIHSRSARGSTEAELRLESLVGGVRSDEFVRQNGASALPSMLTPKLDVLGHVSRRGDLRASDGRWIAGPDSPAPIEGLAIQLVGEASGLTLEYQVQVGGPGGAWSPWMTSGYAGTRGQARPLLGVRLRLVGAQATRFQIDAEALFLGASVRRLTGHTVEAVSGSGVDPLVGLKLLLSAAPLTARDPVQAPAPQPLNATQPNPPLPAARTERVRVFRSAGLR